MPNRGKGRSRIGTWLDDIGCRIFGHTWVRRIYHDAAGAHDFAMCVRCGIVDDEPGRPRK
jgi:hypothetical protein